MRAAILFLAAVLVAVHAQTYNDPLFRFEGDGKPSKLKGRSCIRVRSHPLHALARTIVTCAFVLR
jgi:hypothetical protein